MNPIDPHGTQRGPASVARINAEAKQVEREMKETLYAHFDGMTWPTASERLGEVEWKMRHAQESLTREDLLIAASAISAYSALLSCDTAKRELVAQKLVEQSLLAACEAFLESDNTDGINIAYAMAKEAVANAKRDSANA